MEELKFCKFCGEKIASDAVICPKCGRQVEEVKGNKFDGIVINNNNNNNNNNANAYRSGRRLCNKWVSFVLCLFLGWAGAHKFYEGKIGTGILYLFTGGLFCIGWIFSLLNLLGKPNPYEA